MLKEEIKKTKKELDPVIFEFLDKHQSKDFHNLIDYQIKTGGKRIRPFILKTTYQAFGGDGDVLNEAAAVEIFHNYSLLLDDIIDKGSVRRGKPTSWNKFGLPATLCASSFYFSTIADLLKNTPPKVIDIFVEETKEVMEGELIDVLQDRTSGEDVPSELKDKYKKISYETYLKMIRKKTAALFRASCGMGAAMAGEDEDLALEFGDCFGVAYQIRDDILDIFGDLNDFGKEIGKDIKERKGGNIILIFATEEDKKIEEMFAQNEKIGNREVEEMVKIIERTDARHRAQNLVEEYTDKALEKIDQFPDNKNSQLLKKLVEYIKIRKK